MSLIEAIEKSGLTDKQIARMFGCSIPTVYRWRNGINQPHKSIVPHVIETILGGI